MTIHRPAPSTSRNLVEGVITLRLPILIIVGLVWVWALAILIFGVLDAAPSNDRWTPFLLFALTLLVAGSGSTFVSRVPRMITAAASAGLVGFAAAWRFGGGNVALVVAATIGSAIAWAVLAVSANHLPTSLRGHAVAAIGVGAAVSLYGAAFLTAVWAVRAILAGQLVLAVITVTAAGLLLWRSHVGLASVITSE